MTAKPDRLSVNAAGIPEILRQVDRWLCWSWIWNKNAKKWDKPPLNASSGCNASSTDPSTWTTFNVAIAAHLKGDFDGIGFVLGEDKPSHVVFAGFDLDDCIDDEEAIDPGAAYLAKCLDSYAEISPSGNGIKVFARGHLPPRHRCSEKGKPFEIYDGGRYFTVTGRHLPWSPPSVNERTAELARLYDRLFPSRPNTSAGRSDRDTALAALNAIDDRRAADYSEWLLIGMALHSVADDLLDSWDAWSQRCPDKYVRGSCAEKWRGFRKSGVGLGSLIHWAREDGWKDIPTHLPRSSSPQPLAESNGTLRSDDDDPHMGDGLTEEDSAGPWALRLDRSNPLRYRLRSPIWAESSFLSDGFVLLNEKQIYSWSLIRQAASAQSGVYVPPDRKKKPVWDSCGRGPRLLQRLFRNMRQQEVGIDFDRVLSAVEYILDQARHSPLLTEENRVILTRRSLFRLEDGSVVFKPRSLAASAKKDAPGISYEDLREAAVRYGIPHRPDLGGKRTRFFLLTPSRISDIESEIRRHEPARPDEAEDSSHSVPPVP